MIPQLVRRGGPHGRSCCWQPLRIAAASPLITRAECGAWAPEIHFRGAWRGLHCSVPRISSAGSTATDRAPKADAGGAGGAGSAPASEEARPLPVEERLKKLEATVAAQATKLAEVEKMAKRKGMMMQLVMEYGAPFALWYGTVWFSMWLGIYGLLELEMVSWQESLMPLLPEATAENLDPKLGNAVLAFLANECLEPVRFPLVIATGKPVLNAVRRVRGTPAAAAAAGKS